MAATNTSNTQGSPKNAPPAPVASFRFGTQVVDNAEAAQTVTLNTGTQPLSAYHPTPNLVH